MLYLLLLFVGGLAWFISTVAAGGAATLLIPLVGFILGAELVAPVISVAALCANPSRVWLFRQHIDWTIIRYLLPGSLLGAVLGAWSLSQFSPKWIQIMLGVFLLSYIFQVWFGTSKISVSVQRSWFFPLGIFIAFLSGLIGATGPVLNPFLLSYGLKKEHLVATRAFNSLAMQLTKLLSYSLFGALTLQSGLYGVLIGAGAIIGVYVAHKHLLAIHAERFHFYTLLMMGVCGVLMLYKALFP